VTTCPIGGVLFLFIIIDNNIWYKHEKPSIYNQAIVQTIPYQRQRTKTRKETKKTKNNNVNERGKIIRILRGIGE